MCSPAIVSNRSPDLFGTGIAMNPPGENTEPGPVKLK
jgi:hypothetical protein